jgi:hypothetical protein
MGKASHHAVAVLEVAELNDIVSRDTGAQE